MGEAASITPRRTERSSNISAELILSNQDAATALLILSLIVTVGFTALDFYSHPHQGVADLERRKFLLETIGQVARHLGNFGYTAAASISAVFMKHFFEIITTNTTIHKLVRAGSISLAAGTLAGNALIETFRFNHEIVGDLSMVGLAFIASTLSAELSMARFKHARSAEPTD